MSEQNISKNSFYIGSFKYVSTLRKKNIFNCSIEVFLSLGPKKLGFFFFASAGLRKIKDHSLGIKEF